MADALYVKQGENLIRLDLGTGSGSGGVLTVNRRDTTATTAMTAGTAIPVPPHDPGGDGLLVWWNGLLLQSAQYTDSASTSIKLTFDLAAGDEISAVAVSASSTTASLASLLGANDGKLIDSDYEVAT